MKAEEVKSIKIEFEGTEADSFKSAVKKLEKETSKIGFQQSLDMTADEMKLIRDLNEKINSK